jgi:hypothetical protein
MCNCINERLKLATAPSPPSSPMLDYVHIHHPSEPLLVGKRVELPKACDQWVTVGRRQFGWSGFDLDPLVFNLLLT